MRSRGPRPLITRASALLLAGVLAGCGSSPKAAATANAGSPFQGTSGTPLSCAATVVGVLDRVMRRVYREGVVSERTGAAKHLIAASIPLREAVERRDPAAARAAARALIATGHMTNLRVLVGSRVLIDVGPPALAPLRGTLSGSGGAPIATYVTSVWSDAGLLAEATGVTEGQVSLRAGERSLPGSFRLPAGALAHEGTLTHAGVAYQYTSFPVESYPSGAARMYLLRSVDSTSGLCGASNEDTAVNALSRIATLIYQGESGSRTRPQVRRVQHDQALLNAVAAHDPVATRSAIFALLNHHIVRLRVLSRGRLLADVGGPFVLAPVHGELRLHGSKIGGFVLSIQDDEGYLRLAKRLAGLKVLMYMGTQLVKNSLGPAPGSVPAGGSYSYRGQHFRVFTIRAKAFPRGPLWIRVLIPIPYS